MKGLQAIGITIATADATLVEPVDFHLQPGQPLTLLGETGSGKSLLAQAVMGILPETLQASGTLIINGQRYQLPQDGDALRSLWGRTMASLPQEPWLALDPTMAIQQQVAEGYRYIRGHSAARSVAAAQDDLAELGLQAAAQKFPWQLSGGMAQRAAFAAARAGGAEILIADEPTKGLDVSRRDDVSALLRREVAEGGTLLTITHDIALARQLGGDVIVMHKGKVIEQGAAQQVLNTPQQSYTRELLAGGERAGNTTTARRKYLGRARKFHPACRGNCRLTWRQRQRKKQLWRRIAGITNATAGQHHTSCRGERAEVSEDLSGSLGIVSSYAHDVTKPGGCAASSSH